MLERFLWTKGADGSDPPLSEAGTKGGPATKKTINHIRKNILISGCTSSGRRSLCPLPRSGDSAAHAAKMEQASRRHHKMTSNCEECLRKFQIKTY